MYTVNTVYRYASDASYAYNASKLILEYTVARTICLTIKQMANVVLTNRQRRLWIISRSTSRTPPWRVWPTWRITDLTD